METDSSLKKRLGSNLAHSEKPSFEPGYFLTLAKDTNPMIPESLPTTPGFELESGGMFSLTTKLKLPDQQLPTIDLQLDEGSRKIRKPVYHDDELEYAFPITPPPEEIPSARPTQMTIFNPPMNTWRLFASCVWCFLDGMSDGSVGAILPNIENHYGINYSIVSLIWLGNCLGFMTVAALLHYLSTYLSLHVRLVAPAVLQIIQYSIVSGGTPFWAVVFGYYLGGIGMALGNSNHNYYISRIENSSMYLGFFHGGYGIGATIGPIIATLMVTLGIRWNLFYLVLLGVSVFNAGFLYYTYRNCDEEFAEFEREEESIELSSKSEDSAEAVENGKEKDPSDFSLAIKLVKTWLVSFFVLFYQGAEVGFGSWYVSFLLDYRHAKANSRYVASGFWFGVTISRFCGTPICLRYVGNRRSIILLLLSLIFCVVLSWLVMNVIAASLMASMVGLFIGPVYPLMIGLVTRILPRKVQVISMTIMSAFGSGGGALFPFVIGLMSQYFGTWIMHPIVIGLITVMLMVWIALPNVERIEKEGVAKTWWERIW